MTTPLLRSVELKNGLTLQCVDQSRPIAADRWFVRIGIRLSIPVEWEWFGSMSIDEAQFNSIRDRLGDEVVFTQEKERNFVSDGEKAEVIKDIYERAVEMASVYCGRADFPGKFIIKVYNERKKVDDR